MAARHTAIRWADCHPDRKHHARGLCRRCYKHQISRETYLKKSIGHRRGPLNEFHPAICCPDKPVYARHLCLACYKRHYARTHPRKINNRKATCHPDQPHQAKGLCKDCYMSQYLEAYSKRPRVIERKKERNWKINLGVPLTVAEYNSLLEKQNGGCAICLRKTNGKIAFAVDHDHHSGCVRGLLCTYCNRSLLNPRNTPAVLRRAADYIEASGRAIN